MEFNLQNYYAARAPEYDEVYQKPERQTDLRAIESWLPPIFAGANVLEIACGTGYWTRFIAPVAARVIAIDAAPETLLLARRNVADPKVEFLVGDAYDLALDLGQFDCAFAGFWFSHVPKARRGEFLQGLGTRLALGATVVLLDNLFVEGSSSPLTEIDADANSYQTRLLKDGSRHRVLKNFPSVQELLALSASVGEGGAVT